MLRKRQLIIDAILATLFVFSIICFLLRVKGAFSEKKYSVREISAQLDDDDFDASLIRLNSIDKLTAYCDSFFEANKGARTYPGIVSEVIRKKFYHGYSYYDTKNNPVGVFFEPIVKNSATAIVIPDDIVQHPNAACSQQSIVGMEVFMRKGYNVRKVSMFDSLANTGHFAYEVYYEGGWHFFDTNQQPDADSLRKYNRPSVAFLATHPNIILSVYHKKKDPEMFKRLIMSYKLGPVDKFPAPNAYLYQLVTKFLTNFGWVIIWILIMFRSWRRKRQRKAALLMAQSSEKTYPTVLVSS
jgi:hypothetical protein